VLQEIYLRLVTQAHPVQLCGQGYLGDGGLCRQCFDVLQAGLLGGGFFGVFGGGVAGWRWRRTDGYFLVAAHVHGEGGDDALLAPEGDLVHVGLGDGDAVIDYLVLDVGRNGNYAGIAEGIERRFEVGLQCLRTGQQQQVQGRVDREHVAFDYDGGEVGNAFRLSNNQGEAEIRYQQTVWLVLRALEFPRRVDAYQLARPVVQEIHFLQEDVRLGDGAYILGFHSVHAVVGQQGGGYHGGVEGKCRASGTEYFIVEVIMLERSLGQALYQPGVVVFGQQGQWPYRVIQLGMCHPAEVVNGDVVSGFLPVRIIVAETGTSKTLF